MVDSNLSISPSRKGSRSPHAKTIIATSELANLQTGALDEMRTMMMDLVSEIRQHRTEMNVLRDEMATLRKELNLLQREQASTQNNGAKSPSSENISSVIHSPSKIAATSENAILNKSALSKTASSLSPKSPRTPPPLTISPIVQDYNRSIAIASPIKSLSSDIHSRKSSILISSPGWRKQKLKAASSQKSIRDENDNHSKVKKNGCSGDDENKELKSEKKKWTIELEPHTAESIVECQRQDQALRNFMKTRSGLYDTKYMRIQSVGCFQIFCFKKRVYMPESLRSSTIAYFQKTYGEEALEHLKKNFIWPSLEEDFYSLEKSCSIHNCDDDTLQTKSSDDKCKTRTGEHRRRATFS